MKNKPLFNDESDSGDDKEVVLTTNKAYEKSYNSFRQKELKQKLKDKGLADDGSGSEDDSETSSDDEAGDDLDFDEVFFKTLACLKTKDPKIYDKSVNFFESFDGKKTNREIKKAKPFTVKDLERKVILEKGGKYEDDEDGSDYDQGASKRSASPSIVEKDKELQRELQKVAQDTGSSDEDSDGNQWGGLFTKRSRDKSEEEREEKQYAQWLAGQSNTIKESDQRLLSGLKSYWSSDKLSKDERFLRDYVLKGKYKEGGSANPTYDEVVNGAAADTVMLSDDEQDLEVQEEFEQKYNFRFEEPDKEFLKTYPRTIEWSVRADEEKRKKKRAEVKDRKLREKEQRRQELEVLKELKRKEIQDKIDKLKRVTGNEALPINDDFLNEDFDPDEHDRRMQSMFSDDYYKVDEGDTKPECPDDIEDLKVDDWDNYDPNADADEAGDAADASGSADFNMDCEYDAEQEKRDFQNEIIESTRGRRKRKRQSKFAEMIKKKKPVFDPEDEKTYAEYIDEYYKLDYEDMIGDVPCRFKYVETVPNDFGLSVSEIMLAKNKELNQWASLKKAVQIRPEHIEKNEVRQYQMRGQNMNLKKKILKSLFDEGSDDDNEDEEGKVNESKVSTKKEMTVETPIKSDKTSENGKPTKKSKKKKTTAIPTSSTAAAISTQQSASPSKVAKKQKKRHGNVKQIKEMDKKDANFISDNRLRALGINPKKYHNKLMYGDSADKRPQHRNNNKK